MNDTPTSPPLAAIGGGEPLLRARDVLPLLGGISHVALHRMIKRGTFPKPIRIGSRLRAWPRSVVREWITERESAARANG